MPPDSAYVIIRIAEATEKREKWSDTSFLIVPALARVSLQTLGKRIFENLNEISSYILGESRFFVNRTEWVWSFEPAEGGYALRTAVMILEVCESKLGSTGSVGLLGATKRPLIPTYLSYFQFW